MTPFPRMSRFRSSIAPAWYAIPIRLIVGFGFMEHGYAKLTRGADSFTVILHALGVPEPSLFSWLTILVELLGGFAVLVGALIPLVSIPMAAVLLVETDLLYLAGLAALVLGGSGPFALSPEQPSRLQKTARSAFHQPR